MLGLKSLQTTGDELPCHPSPWRYPDYCLKDVKRQKAVFIYFKTDP